MPDAVLTVRLLLILPIEEDYTDVTGYYSTHFPHPHPPYVREATAHFMRGGRHYLITSGLRLSLVPVHDL